MKGGNSKQNESDFSDATKIPGRFTRDEYGKLIFS
jgi:hypothetical protein